MDDALLTAVCTCIYDLIPALKAEQAELVRRVELGEEPLHQVAGDLGITPNNASVRLHRARRALREALQDACGACADHGCLDCGCRSATRR
jgi:DNA-directed RNA polymerase specialized sigma24 family protein